MLVSYLPLSHIAEQVCLPPRPDPRWDAGLLRRVVREAGQEPHEVRPTVFFGVPRVWEKFKAKAEEGLAEQPPR